MVGAKLGCLGRNLYAYLLFVIVWLLIICDYYRHSKLCNRFYKFKSIAFVFIPFLTQPDTNSLHSRIASS